MNKCDFRQAVVWLRDRLLEALAERAARANVQKATALIIQEPRPKFQQRR